MLAKVGVYSDPKRSRKVEARWHVHFLNRALSRLNPRDNYASYLLFSKCLVYFR
jgi:hypothetical protein